MTNHKRSPGNNPHADRPNWRPAETIDAYLRNCREGLEEYSERRTAELLGWSRAKLWHVRQARAIPDDLFECLINNRGRPDGSVPSWKELAAIGRALVGKDEGAPDAECCPHCGGVLRVRRRWSRESEQIVNDWLAEHARPQ